MVNWLVGWPHFPSIKSAFAILVIFIIELNCIPNASTLLFPLLTYCVLKARKLFALSENRQWEQWVKVKVKYY